MKSFRSWLKSGRGNAIASAQPSGRVLSAEDKLNRGMLAALMLTAAVSVGPAMAFTAPAAGSLGYDIYNVVVNQLLSGPIGFVGGVVLIVWGATQVMKQWLITVLCIIAGTVIITAQTIVTSLGALVH